jgi:hypothetical protein
LEGWLKLTEEKVTKTIIYYLKNKGWNIIAYDFPQSGTGIMLHPDNSCSEKNKGAIIPDIIAVKNGVCLFFENKDRFYYPDYIKLNELKIKDNYRNSILQLICNYNVNNICYGVGLPTKKHTSKADDSKHLVDFVVGVNEDDSIKIIYDNYNVLL